MDWRGRDGEGVSDVAPQHGDSVILRDINIRIKPGQMTAIVGTVSVTSSSVSCVHVGSLRLTGGQRQDFIT